MKHGMILLACSVAGLVAVACGGSSEPPPSAREYVALDAEGHASISAADVQHLPAGAHLAIDRARASRISVDASKGHVALERIDLVSQSGSAVSLKEHQATFPMTFDPNESFDLVLTETSPRRAQASGVRTKLMPGPMICSWDPDGYPWICCTDGAGGEACYYVKR